MQKECYASKQGQKMSDQIEHGANDPVQRTEEDREFAAISDEEIWSEAKDRLQIAAEAYSENRKRAKAAMLFRDGDQWDHDVVTSASEDSPETTNASIQVSKGSTISPSHPS